MLIVGERGYVYRVSEVIYCGRVERDWDENESLVPFVSRPRREHQETLTNLSGFQYLGTRSGLRLLESYTNGRVRDRDLSIKLKSKLE
jgi:hypothetical protein